MAFSDRQRSWLGIGLIVLGLFLLLDRLGKVPGSLTLIVIGAAFLVAYYRVRPTIGFLLPGCLLVGLGLGETLSESLLIPPAYEDVASLGGLGFGFLLVGLLDGFRKRAWTFIPAVVLGVLALYRWVEISGAWDSALWVAAVRWWPIILVIGGLWMILGSRWSGR